MHPSSLLNSVPPRNRGARWVPLCLGTQLSLSILFPARLTGNPEAREARGCGGACFQPDRVPGRSRVLRLRVQPVVAPALPTTCASCIELELVAFVTPGPWDVRLSGQCQLQVREEHVRNPGVRWSDPRDGSDLPGYLRAAQGPRTGAPRPQLLFLSHFPAYWLRLTESGNRWKEGPERLLLLCCDGSCHLSHIFPGCSQSDFDPCLPFLSCCGILQPLDSATPLGAYWLWTIRARTRGQDPFSSAPER